MNWYTDNLIVQERIAAMQSERNMDRLADAALGKAPFTIGLEDLLSARALVAQVFLRVEDYQAPKAQRLMPHTAAR